MEDEEPKKISPFKNFLRQCSRPEGMVILTALSVIQYWLVTLLGSKSYKYSALDGPSSDISIIFMIALVGFLLTVGSMVYINSMTSIISLEMTPTKELFIKASSSIWIITFLLSILHNNGYINIGFLFPEQSDIDNHVINLIYALGSVSSLVLVGMISGKKVPFAVLIFTYAMLAALAFYFSTYIEAKKSSYVADAKYCYWLYLIHSSQPHLGDKTDPTCLRLGISSRSPHLHLID